MSAQRRRAITRWLEEVPAYIPVVYTMTAAATTYFCMYAFRKPFVAAEYEGLRFLNTQVDLKTAMVISQTIGYTLSKYMGVKLCSELRRKWRAPTLWFLVIFGEMALLLFAVVPENWRVVAIFLNGLPLGMVFGLVVRYLEGRRTSEILLAGLSVSIIMSGAAVKDFGRMVMTQFAVTESWMPAVTGMCFLPLFLFSVWLLDRAPEPNRWDVELRTKRNPMFGTDRATFVRRFFPGLAVLLAVCFLLTAYRDFRDAYGVEIFKLLGHEKDTAIFLRTELLAALGVMAALAALGLMRSNRVGLGGAFGIMIAGLLLMGFSTLLHDAGAIGGRLWMALIGLGAYLAYIPFGSVLFDRLMASTKTAGTAVFAICVADATGYTGSIVIQLFRDLLQSHFSRLHFFHGLTYFVSLFGTLLLAVSCVYFLRKSS